MPSRPPAKKAEVWTESTLTPRPRTKPTSSPLDHTGGGLDHRAPSVPSQNSPAVLIPRFETGNGRSEDAGKTKDAKRMKDFPTTSCDLNPKEGRMKAWQSA